jgi:hypothetical protein
LNPAEVGRLLGHIRRDPGGKEDFCLGQETLIIQIRPKDWIIQAGDYDLVCRGLLGGHDRDPPRFPVNDQPWVDRHHSLELFLCDAGAHQNVDGPTLGHDSPSLEAKIVETILSCHLR